MIQPSLLVKQIFDKYIGDEKLRQLLITHSTCVAAKALNLAERCGMLGRIDTQFLVDAAMLHDIGVVECDAPGIHCHGSRPYLQHGLAGADILIKEGLDERYARVCRTHIGAGLTSKEIEGEGLPLPACDFLPETLEEKLICYADNFFSKSHTPEMEKPLEVVEKSMAKLGPEVFERFLKMEKLFSEKPNKR